MKHEGLCKWVELMREGSGAGAEEGESWVPGMDGPPHYEGPQPCPLGSPIQIPWPFKFPRPQCGAFCHPMPTDPSRETTPHSCSTSPYKTACTDYQNPINAEPFNRTQCDRWLLLFPGVRCGHGLREVPLHAEVSQLTEEPVCLTADIFPRAVSEERVGREG